MSTFREVLVFLDTIGIYDVVLPLLLIFSIVYAILEKTRVFGVEKIKTESGDHTVTRKNVNAMVAFVSAFFVVSSAQLVGTIHKLIADVALVLVTFVMFMILIGVFHKDEELNLKDEWNKRFMWIAFIAITLIFFNALGWLMPAWYYLVGNWDSTFAATVMLLLGMVLLILWVAKDQKPKKSESKSD